MFYTPCACVNCSALRSVYGFIRGEGKKEDEKDVRRTVLSSKDLEDIKKKNEEARSSMPVYTDDELESLDYDEEETDNYYDNVDYDEFDKYYDED